jgi:hypothetical protein
MRIEAAVNRLNKVSEARDTAKEEWAISYWQNILSYLERKLNEGNADLGIDWRV